MTTRGSAAYGEKPQYVSVKDFGAIGDGVTSDAAAIAAAITDIGSPGGMVVFPGATGYVGSLPASYPTVVLEYHGPKTPINVYQESGETTRWGKRVYRGQNATTRNGEEYSLFVVEHHPVGSGTNGPTSADYALTVVNQKQDFDTTAVVGEIDGINVVVRQGGAASDAAGMLINIASYGTGFIGAIEAQTSIISGGSTTRQIQTQVGILDNVNSNYFGYFAKSVVGTNNEAYRVDSVAGNLWTYMFRGYSVGVEKFNISAIGVITLFDSSGNKKAIRCSSDTLNILNSAADTQILTLTDAGALTAASSLTVGGTMGVLGAAIDASAIINIPSSTTARSCLRLAHGTAPTSPVNGDMWTTTAGLYVRINGATVGPLA